ncbi:UTP--glucose-1-phosphate uridylyltransferase GalU [Bacillus sp. FJAT-49736]|uniref:UTP--glucose-1-phosphate uridylyltransferase GalU n=1 Tax=Bacillus sp. FJAT-49736 TaxID=2833582 RepID=UPI001BC92F68|nr:UTP--glucose-1-phosphate uridylyltransferase GalU [Bacillus sp. FJAT-49736]
MKKQIKKAIIPAAGLGTRFLPATKAMPKEMLPIVDKPTIQYIVEEAFQSGIEDIIIVTGKGKRAIEDHFDHATELELTLLKRGKLDLLEGVQRPSKLANIHYIRQMEPKGLGHAIWCARKFIGDEPFAVLLGDDVVQADVPCTKQLMEIYEQTGFSVVGVKEVPQKETNRYGIIAPSKQHGKVYDVDYFVEKPSIEDAPSNLAIMGRYILTPEIFAILEKQKSGVQGEIQLTDAIMELSHSQKVYAYAFDGMRYDVGEKLGFILTNIEFALKQPALRKPLLQKIKQIMEAEEDIIV